MHGCMVFVTGLCHTSVFTQLSIVITQQYSIGQLSATHDRIALKSCHSLLETIWCEETILVNCNPNREWRPIKLFISNQKEEDTIYDQSLLCNTN